jgi:hypothetical protein
LYRYCAGLGNAAEHQRLERDAACYPIRGQVVRARVPNLVGLYKLNPVDPQLESHLVSSTPLILTCDFPVFKVLLSFKFNLCRYSLDAVYLAELGGGAFSCYAIQRGDIAVLGGTHEKGEWDETPDEEVAAGIVERVTAMLPARLDTTFTTLFCRQNTVQLMTASMVVHVKPI